VCVYVCLRERVTTNIQHVNIAQPLAKKQTNQKQRKKRNGRNKKAHIDIARDNS